MVEGSRITPQRTSKHKTRLVLDKKFRFIRDLPIGSKGQLKVDLSVERLRFAFDGKNDIKHITFKVKTAELLKTEDSRQ